MKFFRDLISFCRFMAAGFRKWFMPLPLERLTDEEEEAAQKRTQKRKTPNEKKSKPVAKPKVASAAKAAGHSPPDLADKQSLDPAVDLRPATGTAARSAGASAPAVAAAGKEQGNSDEAQTPRRKIIDILTLSNSRRVNHLARGAHLAEKEGERIVKELVEEGVIVQGRAGWQRLASERRLSLLETNAQLLPVLELMRNEAFRREALELFFDLLENYRISLQPRGGKVAVILKSRRVALFTFTAEAITVKLFGSFDIRFDDLVERAGGATLARDEQSMIFDWRTAMNSANVASLLRDTLEQRMKTARRPSASRRTKAKSPAPKSSNAPKSARAPQQGQKPKRTPRKPKKSAKK